MQPLSEIAMCRQHMCLSSASCKQQKALCWQHVCLLSAKCKQLQQASHCARGIHAYVKLKSLFLLCRHFSPLPNISAHSTIRLFIIMHYVHFWVCKLPLIGTQHYQKKMPFAYCPVVKRWKKIVAHLEVHMLLLTFFFFFLVLGRCLQEWTWKYCS